MNRDPAAQSSLNTIFIVIVGIILLMINGLPFFYSSITWSIVLHRILWYSNFLFLISKRVNKRRREDYKMEELNIILNEDENKLIEQFKKIQQQNELVDSYPSSFAKNINGKIYKLYVKIFREQIIPYIEKNPGCKQSILKRRVPNAIRDNISLFLYISAKNNLTKRTKGQINGNAVKNGNKTSESELRLELRCML